MICLGLGNGAYLISMLLGWAVYGGAVQQGGTGPAHLVPGLPGPRSRQQGGAEAALYQARPQGIA